jgi:hypothetical protein
LKPTRGGFYFECARWVLNPSTRNETRIANEPGR